MFQEYPVAIALGGNIGAVAELFAMARAALADAGLRDIRMAHPIVTAAVGCRPGTPDFLNTSLIGGWRGTAAALFAAMQAVELAAGRPPRHAINASRPLDLDLLLFGDRIIVTPVLMVPHPRMIKRRFVLSPLAEIAGNWVIPPTRLTVLEALAELDSSSDNP